MRDKPHFLYFSSKTSRARRISVSYPKIFLIVIIVLVFSFFSLKYFIDFVMDFSQNSKITQLKEQNDLLQQQLLTMNSKLTSLRDEVNEIEKMEDEFRSIFNYPPIDSDVRQVGVGGANIDPNSQINFDDYPFGEELSLSLEMLEKLEREIKFEQASYQELINTVKSREDSLRYLPVLKPVPNGRVTDRFGNRRHPILKRIKFHHGVDIAADRGSPVIAPADGYVSYAGRNGGFGNFIRINHKYGYKTNYGHLNKIFVRRGQYVKRGDKIGEVGSTGLSTSNHLHYEIRLNRNSVNPDQFFLNDIVYY
jgi:murein DD-endopeptidase MepM/ murein hydrolase activator NlpD